MAHPGFISNFKPVSFPQGAVYFPLASATPHNKAWQGDFSVLFLL